ncbi:MAG: polysaccharide deacetylase family protein [Nibricoccus sp.]
MLRKHGLTALLAVSPGLITEQAPADTAARLALSIDDTYRDPSRGGFCTWSELRELVAGGNIAIAAHGCTHVSLDSPTVDLESEIVLPRAFLTARLGVPVNSFVFPFGRFSKEALKKVRANYRYAFRIGGAINDHWKHRVLYRVDGDSMKNAKSLTTSGRLIGYHWRFFWNRLRGR